MKHAKSLAKSSTHLLLVLLVALSLGDLAAAETPATRPNVIVILTDDQGYGDLSCHGNPVLKTPHLDQLASQSVRLTNFHATPMCTPTRGQLMTGLDAFRNGAMNVSSGRTLLRRGIPTMANYFAAAGYRCGQFGKWHLGDNYPYRPHDRGFHEAIYYASSHIGSAADPWNNDYFDDTYSHNGHREQYQGYTTDVFFNEAIRWMGQQADSNQPFLCYLPTAAAHGPLFVPDRYRQLYPNQPRNVASFFGMIANIDENIGQLEQFLTDKKLRDNTLVVFMTDNGGTAGVNVYNAGMRGKKIELYEGGHRVPCFIRWPNGKLRSPSDVTELTEVQDILPTLLDLCHIQPKEPPHFDGSSLASLVTDKQDHLPDRKLVVQFSRMNAPQPKPGDACVLWNDWRLVNNTELFNIRTDPSQKTNVATDHPEVVADLCQHYDQWWQSVSPKLNDFSPIVLGNDAENPAQLSACEWADVFLDQMAQVRRGEKKNGTWHVEIERPGTYEFTLRRWPAEADLPITAAAPEHHGPDGNYLAGIALPITKARLKIATTDESKPLTATDKSITFTVNLPSGPAELQTWFTGTDNTAICGAYFVTVRRR